MSRVLVTGSSGFIGQHLVQALVREGHDVRGLDSRDPVRPDVLAVHERCNLLDAARTRDVLGRFQPDVVLHLAARTDLDETHDLNGYAANIQGVDNLVRAIRSTPSVCRAICTSSQLVCRIGYVPANDEDYQPSTLYGQSKVETERIWRREDGGGVEWAIVRPTTIWGPGMNPHYLRFFEMIRRGRYFHVSGGPRRKSYGFVGNTVHEYLRLLAATPEQLHGRMFFLADYEPITIEGWAEAFGRALGAPRIRTLPLGAARIAAAAGDLLNLIGLRRFPFNSFRLGNVITQYLVNVAPTRQVCGPLPFTMEQGVDLTATWLRAVWAGAELAELPQGSAAIL
ncbi:MAG: NAD(P)-dependent oxidoreductase, partial [Gemmatimonadota bacterium]